ncbi:DUF1028 domain-containing protein [Fulvivirga ligni]|uniref:DUF1028 domain-containing protein n=1 Tax=Fulvivirga ligni TaxID=2904246 RepID=UPI001F37A07C|nr:DUF1028 domain-containing protein [Fulvivirga ligni]UII19937.1 DUF1028 domain-containing protein [Fulvivirga ligni]
MKKIYLVVLLSLLLSPAFSQLYLQKEPLAHTYSIVARDPETGEMAVAVQSHWFSVGTSVSWGEAGVGVVATQSFTNKSFGLRGLALLKEGKTAEQALKILLKSDEGREVRQVAILDSKGNVATHTGEKCIKYAGHQQGDNFSVQANMMLTKDVWPAMAEAYEKAKDLPLAERVLKALEAAQAAGGDIRGKQSAALLVVKGQPAENAWDDPMIDLRVDDSEEPLKELKRLLTVYRAYEHMNNGDLALEVGDMSLALQEYGKAQSMFPDNLEMKYWTAVTLANNGKLDEALPMFKAIFREDDNWRELTERLPAVGLLELDKKDLKKILKVK